MSSKGITSAMILAAGRGSRLAPLTDDIPKPLLEIHGQPLIAHQLRWLKRAGIERVVINLFHLGADIRRELGDGSQFGLTINYSIEPRLLETGGGIAHARKLLGEEPFILLNGDIWTDFDFAGLPRALPPHLTAHLVTTPTPPNRSTGDFEYAHHRLWRPSSETRRRFVYCGIGVWRASAVGTRTGSFSLRDVLFEAARQGRLAGQHFNGVWRDIGTLDELISVRTGPPLKLPPSAPTTNDLPSGRRAE